MNRNQEDMVFSTKLNQNIGKRKKEDRSDFAFLKSMKVRFVHFSSGRGLLGQY